MSVQEYQFAYSELAFVVRFGRQVWCNPMQPHTLFKITFDIFAVSRSTTLTCTSRYVYRMPPCVSGVVSLNPHVRTTKTNPQCFLAVEIEALRTQEFHSLSKRFFTCINCLWQRYSTQFPSASHSVHQESYQPLLQGYTPIITRDLGSEPRGGMQFPDTLLVFFLQSKYYLTVCLIGVRMSHGTNARTMWLRERLIPVIAFGDAPDCRVFAITPRSMAVCLGPRRITNTFLFHRGSELECLRLPQISPICIYG